MVRYSVSTWIYGDEPLEKSLQRLSKFGYDGVEIPGEPKKINAKRVRELLEKNGLGASSICGLYSTERDLTSSDAGTRRNAVQYVKNCAKFASDIGAEIVIVVPTAVGKTKPEKEREKEWKWAVSGIKEAGQYAGDLGVILAVEPINRFETYMVNRAEQAERLAREVALDNVKIMVDTFHMNIEEASPSNAIKKFGEKIVHVHLADNTRAPPGKGNTDFESIFNALKTVGYDRYLAMEFMPPSAYPYDAIREVKPEEFDRQTKESIENMKRIW